MYNWDISLKEYSYNLPLKIIGEMGRLHIIYNVNIVYR